MRRLVFVAGPYAAPTDAETARNVERARLLGVLAVRRGLAPIVPHLAGRAGLYGSGIDDGTGEERAAALEVSTAHARAVGAYGGDLWVIAREGGGLSDGCRQEWWAWQDGRDAADVLDASAQEAPWSWWHREIEAEGIVVVGTPADDVVGEVRGPSGMPGGFDSRSPAVDDVGEGRGFAASPTSTSVKS